MKVESWKEREHNLKKRGPNSRSWRGIGHWQRMVEAAAGCQVWIFRVQTIPKGRFCLYLLFLSFMSYYPQISPSSAFSLPLKRSYLPRSSFLITNPDACTITFTYRAIGYRIEIKDQILKTNNIIIKKYIIQIKDNYTQNLNLSFFYRKLLHFLFL